jgi:hypothetical protein
MQNFNEMKSEQNSWRQEKRIAIEKFFTPENLIAGSHTELGRIDEIGKVIGWKSDSMFATEHEFEVRKIDGKRFELLSEAEQDDSASEYKTEILYWDRDTGSLAQNDSAI